MHTDLRIDWAADKFHVFVLTPAFGLRFSYFKYLYRKYSPLYTSSFLGMTNILYITQPKIYKAFYYSLFSGDCLGAVFESQYEGLVPVKKINAYFDKLKDPQHSEGKYTSIINII